MYQAGAPSESVIVLTAIGLCDHIVRSAAQHIVTASDNEGRLIPFHLILNVTPNLIRSCHGSTLYRWGSDGLPIYWAEHIDRGFGAQPKCKAVTCGFVVVRGGIIIPRAALVRAGPD